jgi:D-tyrosyl-tRNA(Tyr) deacylase
MKALIQRVTEASVEIAGEPTRQIGAGLVVLVGVCAGDGDADVDYLARKTLALRIFEDAAGKMNRSLHDVHGEVLVISQFTLYANTRKGNRPSFVAAGEPAVAERLYERYKALLGRDLGAERMQSGTFAAEMLVRIANDGPVTIELCSDWRKQ